VQAAADDEGDDRSHDRGSGPAAAVGFIGGLVVVLVGCGHGCLRWVSGTGGDGGGDGVEPSSQLAPAGPGPGVAGHDQVVDGAGEEEPERVDVDVGRHPAGPLLRGAVPGEDRLEGAGADPGLVRAW
jgi:hypothetical protein